MCRQRLRMRQMAPRLRLQTRRCNNLRLEPHTTFTMLKAQRPEVYILTDSTFRSSVNESLVHVHLFVNGEILQCALTMFTPARLCGHRHRLCRS